MPQKKRPLFFYHFWALLNRNTKVMMKSCFKNLLGFSSEDFTLALRVIPRQLCFLDCYKVRLSWRWKLSCCNFGLRDALCILARTSHNFCFHIIGQGGKNRREYHPQIWKEAHNPSRLKWKWRAVRGTYQCSSVFQFMTTHDNTIDFSCLGLMNADSGSHWQC